MNTILYSYLIRTFIVTQINNLLTLTSSMKLSMYLLLIVSNRANPRTTMTMLRINDPIGDAPVRKREDTNEDKTLTIGFAYLLLFIIRPSRVL
jgi:hypothetical protein